MAISRRRFHPRAGASRRTPPVVARAFHDRRHAHRSLGGAQKLPAQGGGRSLRSKIMIACSLGSPDIFVNERDIRFLSGVTRLEDGAEMSIVPAMAGW